MSTRVSLAESAADRAASWTVRERVFIHEQQIDESLERDDLDDLSWHFVAWDGSEPVGTARVFGLDDEHRAIAPDRARVVKIGRMAVLASHRRHGIGRALLDAAIERASKHGAERAELSAQEYVVAFYAGAGFRADGERYLEAGIPHRHMSRELRPERSAH